MPGKDIQGEHPSNHLGKIVFEETISDFSQYNNGQYQGNTVQTEETIANETGTEINPNHKIIKMVKAMQKCQQRNR